MNHNGGDNRDVTYFFLHTTKEHLTQFSKKLIVKSFPELETLVVVPLNPEEYSYKTLIIKKKDFKEFKLIDSLGINRVGVDDLPNDVFNHLTQLTALNLGSNKISNLPFNLLDSLPELRILEVLEYRNSFTQCSHNGRKNVNAQDFANAVRHSELYCK
jgi:hypothetical protein